MDQSAMHIGLAGDAPSSGRAACRDVRRQRLPHEGPDDILGRALRRNLSGGLPHLHIARPVTDVELAARMYSHGLTLRVLSSFRDHRGFDGMMVGASDAPYHLEFTRSRCHPLIPRPTAEDLLVFYYPSESQWRLSFERMGTAGFEEVAPFNPYWGEHGRTFKDHDGYHVVLQQAAWTP